MMNLGDNYVTGDNIYLRELQNFFFEVLGMMSITHYGAIGDGRTDNYGPLQVAIDDAHRRGLNYLYVPYGKFIYTGELINIGDIKFVGNPHSKIVNIRTEEEITIHQFGAPGYFVESYSDLNAKPTMNGETIVGDMTSSDLGLQGELTAGDGISIEDNVIATDGMQQQLIAGANISISSNNVISAFEGAAAANTPSMMAKLSGDVAISEMSTIVPFSVSTTSATGSEYFTLENNKIVVGTGITKVLVSFSTNISHAGSSGLRSLSLMKNTTTVYRLDKDELFPQFDVSNYLIDVQEGDRISLVYVGESGDTIEDTTYLTVTPAEIVSEVIEPFFSSLLPRAWTSGAAEATASNSYGTWTSLCKDAVGTGKIGNVFDGSDTTYASILTASNDKAWIEIDMPEGVSISPRTIRYVGYSNRVKFMGYDGTTWEQITTFSPGSSSSNVTVVDVSSSKFYTKFKVTDIYNGGLEYRDVYEFDITKGIIKH